MGDNMFKMLLKGVMVVVPRPIERVHIALHTHRSMGHFGVQRALDRLQNNYWWRGMGDTVVSFIKACLPCAHVKARFKEWQGVLATAYTGAGVSLGGGLCKPLGNNLR